MSLKMYFGLKETVEWCRSVAALAVHHPIFQHRLAEMFVLPSMPLIPSAVEVFSGTPILVGAQNLHPEDRGAFTGETSGTVLRELGCRFAEVGHAERRRLFGEHDDIVAAKMAAAWRNGLTPVLCVGERDHEPAARAAAICMKQIVAALRAGQSDRLPLVVAYEPHWAIGQTQPASSGHIGAVASELRGWLAKLTELDDYRLIYGGSAAPGLLTALGPAVDGLFLGRFAHDPKAVQSILDEALRIAVQRSVGAAKVASWSSG